MTLAQAGQFYGIIFTMEPIPREAIAKALLDIAVDLDFLKISNDFRSRQQAAGRAMNNLILLTYALDEPLFRDDS